MMFNKEQILRVLFDKTPDVRCRILEEKDKNIVVTSKDGRKRTLWDDKLAFPYKLYSDVVCIIETNKRTLKIEIKAQYSYDGASIPKSLHSLIGSKGDPKFLIAALVHDWLLEFMKDIYKTVDLSISEFRRLTSLTFRQILKQYEVNTVKANVMAWCVQIWQCTGSRKQWDELKGIN